MLYEITLLFTHFICKYHHHSFIPEARVERGPHVSSGIMWETVTHLPDIIHKDPTGPTTDRSNPIRAQSCT